ncbi:prominin-1-A-like isoform X3 [Eriocheir sinensis]|uniref:prominin-1-A-like isoform X3 n=1 Tax=Eriocheir sinensis TaxID=95602 RepID=UPI0021C5EE91|nr:prominin-1-A-like isoform X3 [Eriocheir sinensis]
MAGMWRVGVAVLLVVCAGAGADTRDSSTVTPPDPPPQVTVAFKVLQRNGTEVGDERPQGVAVLGMGERGAKGNRSLVWGSGFPPVPAPPPAPPSQDAPSRRLPLPIVTVASRLLFSPERKERERERERENKGARSSLVGDIPVHKIEFAPVPEGDVYRTDKTHAQSSILAWAGAFVSLLQPASVPLDLIRAAWEQRVSGEELIRESLKVEPGFVACMGVAVGLAVGVPAVGLFVCCCRLCGRCGGSKTQHHHTSCFNCQRRSLIVFLSAISSALLLGVVVVVVSNERLGSTVGVAQRSVHNNVRDLDTFLANTKMQLRFLVTNAYEQTTDAIFNDLDDIEYLLGRPLQRELAAEAQIEVALDSLLHISSSLRNIASRMRTLEESRSQAAARAEELRGRLAELTADIQRFVSRCSLEDMELCATLDTRGLDIGSRFDSFSFSEQLRHLAAVENQNLTETARHARLEFENIPSYVEAMTRSTRQEVKSMVREYRAPLYTKVRGLDGVAFDLEVRTRDLTWRFDRAAAILLDHETYRWYTGLSISVALGLVWVLVTVGVCCGSSANNGEDSPTERSCASNSAGQTLISSVFFMFLVSGVLWVAVMVLFLIGAHAHAFICHPLYEEPNFPTLTHLLDHSGMVYQNRPVLTNLLHPGRDVQLNMGNVLNQCREGRTAYEVFQLRHYFDLEEEVTRRTTFDLSDSLGRLKVNLSQVQLLSPEAEVHLDQFLNSIKIDLMPYRKEMEKPLVKKNLPALAEQMQTVAGQLRSVSASAELFRMVSRVRNLITTTLYPLEKRKEDVTYQVATLDLEAMPLQRQINQSAGHLRTIQYFIHNHGSSLAAAKARGYVERLTAYTRQFATHVRNSALHTVAPCTPVWDLYDSARGLACKGIIEPLNALWLATSWCLLLFLPSICLGLALARFFLRMDYDDDTLPLHSNGSPPESNTNLQGGSWSYKERDFGGQRQSYTPHHHQHNGRKHW